MTHLPVFSPSQTSVFSFCPIKWQLEQEGYRPEMIGRKEAAIVAGNAFAAAMEAYNKNVMVEGFERVRSDTPFQKTLIARLQDEVKASIENQLAALKEQGFTPLNEMDFENLDTKVMKATERFVKEDPTPVDWRVHSVEEPMKEHGWSRSDVVYILPSGKKHVIDYKLKLGLRADLIPVVLNDYGKSTQRWHSTWMHEAERFTIYLVIAYPFRVEPSHFDRDEARLEQWLTSQKSKWGLMQEIKDGRRDPWENDAHEDKWGPCPFTEACLTYGRDRAMMKASGYIQLTKRI